MATTSPDNIWTQDSADNYDLVVDAAATATSIQTALVARANSYTGTTTQRTAFTASAPEGTLWSDINGEKFLWIKQGASWSQVWPWPRGVPQGSQVQVVASGSSVVSLAVASFDTPHLFIVQNGDTGAQQNAQVVGTLNAMSSLGGTISVRVTGASGGNMRFNWIAIPLQP